MKSVVAKQARAMPDLVRSCRFVLTAIITRTFHKTVNGQVKAFMTVLTTNAVYTAGEIFVGSRGKTSKPHPSVVVLLSSETFILAWLTDSLQRLFLLLFSFLAFYPERMN